MSKEQTEGAEDKSITEKVIRRVNKIYENYGVDPNGLDEGDITKVYRHYAKHPGELESDYKRSLRHTSGDDDDA